MGIKVKEKLSSAISDFNSSFCIYNDAQKDIDTALNIQKALDDDIFPDTTLSAKKKISNDPTVNDSFVKKKKPIKEKSEDYVDKVARRKEIDKQIKELAAIAITTKDTLDKLRNEQAELDKWLEAYKVIHKE